MRGKRANNVKISLKWREGRHTYCFELAPSGIHWRSHMNTMMGYVS